MREGDKMCDKIILKDSDEAARYIENLQVSGWVDNKGCYWGDNERAARYAGCTHVKCEKCGFVYPKSSYCGVCSINLQNEKYRNMPTKKWDGISLLYSDSNDIYFNDMEEVLDYCDNHECQIDDLRLIVCRPVYLKVIEDDYWEDQLPYEREITLDDIDTTLVSLIDKVNKYIIENKPIVAWKPSKYALSKDE